MNDTEIRLQCLALAMPKTITDPAMDTVLKRAQAFYEFVVTDRYRESAGQLRPILTIPADTGKATRKA